MSTLLEFSLCPHPSYSNYSLARKTTSIVPVKQIALSFERYRRRYNPKESPSTPVSVATST